MIEPKFSIIVPVYNAQSTIKKTIETLQTLDYDDYEVIIVNDGSTDETETMILTLTEENPIFQLITTENNGPGIARNIGIEQAKGTYILLFDADDEPSRSILKNYDQLLTDHPEADLIVSSFLFRTMDNEKVVSEKVNQVSEAIYRNHETFIKDMYHLMNQQLMYVVWNKCYRRDIVMGQNIRFKNYRSCEDRIFNLDYYRHCQYVVMNPTVAYTYEFVGGQGITNKYYPNKFQTFKEFYLLANTVTNSINKPGMAALLLKGTTSVIFSIYGNSDQTSKEKTSEAKRVLADPVIVEAKNIALTDSTAKKVTKLLYNLPAPIFLSAVRLGSFVEERMPGLMAFLKRSY
ncbi:hypothetical protein IGL24_000926 [Enterococcus sp. DIV2371]|uniref:Glycosyltransferase 2-like domain-containing protein n=1 Tax=Candidatus Enterococcus mangumiae TaxID=2230878 RepID=A0ABZ2SXT4_9ENTE|nr:MULTISPECIES: glycosyltransferase family A protein [unclassified Enterococcus]MBO0460993.1 glycosyltransferase family 2 protein [Enterococcus sp. DIV1298c]MBO0490841.1 glycosyltransferase family 2 protein [Enterococcus sp. DIV1094]